MRSPDDKRTQVEKAVEEARTRLRWLTIDCSRWTGLDPKNDWKNEFYNAVELVARILKDDAKTVSYRNTLPVLGHAMPSFRRYGEDAQDRAALATPLTRCVIDGLRQQ